MGGGGIDVVDVFDWLALKEGVVGRLTTVLRRFHRSSDYASRWIRDNILHLNALDAWTRKRKIDDLRQ